MNAATSPRRRILHVMTRFLDAGSERNVLHFMDWEQSAGFDVELAVGGPAPEGLPEKVRIHRLRWLVRQIDPARDLLAIREIRSLVREERFDIVHTHQSKAGIVGRIGARGVVHRIAHTVHMASFGPGYSRPASHAFEFAERRCAAMANLLVFVGTQLESAYLRAGIGEADASMVIRSPVGIEDFLATRSWTSAQRGDAKGAFGVARDASMLVAAGALTPRKRYLTMLQQLAPFLLSANIHLVIAGEGPERSRIAGEVDRLGIADKVHLVGHTPRMPELMAGADVIVHTSAVEGVPQVLIQGLAAGRPIVASEVIGLREVQSSAIAVVPADASGLALKVRAHIDQPPSPISPTLLSPWTTAEIDPLIGEFHRRLAPAP